MSTTSTPRETAPLPIRLPNGLARAVARVYGHVAARLRRRARELDLQRRLRQPVISVGSLVVGGAGKTPVVAAMAALLRDAGERPAILSRGYARSRSCDGVVVVRDFVRLRADLERSGDEPLMLARALDGVAVVVAEDRHLAGVVAESRLGATVHVLDDGFQHLALARDVDLLLVEPRHLDEGPVLPAGPLREPPEAAWGGDAWIVPAGRAHEVQAAVAPRGTPPLFEVRRRLGVPRLVEPWGQAPRVSRTTPVAALAAIATPERFFEALEAEGWQISARFAFGDHHAFTPRDVERVADEARAAGAALLLTTEKDLVRLLPWRPLPFPVAWVPLAAEVEPKADFAAWIATRLATARDRGWRARD